ncbi:peptidylprolyl isomerase [soil metagenome]
MPIPDATNPGKKQIGSSSGKQSPEPVRSPLRQRASSVFVNKNTAPPAKRRRISRKERDDKRTRRLYIALAVVGFAIIAMISAGALNEYFLKPRKVLASVEGEDITRRDYWKYREHTLINQALQYQQFAMVVEGQQQQQYLSLAQQAQAQLEDVWGSTSFDETTLSQMVDDMVYTHSLETLGLSISDEEISAYVDNQFSDPSAPITSPTPTQTLIPERAEWATQTAVAGEALQGSPAAVDGSPAASPAAADPGGGGSPVPIDANPSPASPVAFGSPRAPGSPAESGSPEAVESPTPSPTVGPEGARATSAANQENYANDVLEDAHMSMSDYERLVAGPALAREKVNAYFQDQVGQSAEQVHASHILVGTQELADQLYSQLQSAPESFANLASEASIDEGTAANGGDLGWFPRGIMVEPFEEIAFDLEPGAISEPFQTEFGWHIVQVTGHEPNRALSEEQITQSTQSLADRWLAEQRVTLDISSSVDPTPTPSISQFVPPSDAPPVPTPTAIGSPVLLPDPSPVGSPGASPLASPQPVSEESNG